MDMADSALTVAVFPGAANAPLMLARQRGWFVEAALDISVIEVVSSDEQFELWESARCHVMHTSPDHLLRKRRSRDPVIVRRDGVGELAVFRRPEHQDLRAIEWAVDGLDSGFAFVMRALLEDHCGLPASDQRLRAVGGTKQRFEALMAGEVGGTTLHPPFDRLASDAGCVRLAGHLELVPALLTAVTVVPRADLRSDPITAYLKVLDRANALLVTEGAATAAAVLEAQGLPAPVAAAAAVGMLGPGGLEEERAPSLEGLRAVATLRARFDADWSPPSGFEDLLENAQSGL